MTDALRMTDRAMFYALLLLVIFIPYSAAVIQGCLFILMLALLLKCFLIWKHGPSKIFSSNFNSISGALAWPLILIAILIAFTIPFSQDWALSLKKFFSRYVQQIFLMYVVIEIIQTPKRFYQILLFLMWTLVVVITDVFVQYQIGHSFIFHKHTLIFQRVSGSMRHPNDLGSLLVTVIPIVLGLVLTSRFWIPLIFSKKYYLIIRNICIVLLVGTLISLGLTTSRGAWLAFALMVIGGCVFLKKNLWTGVAILFLVLFFWVFGTFFVNERTDIFSKEEVSAKEDSAKIVRTSAASEAVLQKTENRTPGEKFLNPSRRFEYWHTAIDVVKHYPLFGCGYNAYIQTLKELKLKPEEYPHNSLLHITAELGFLGLLLYLWFFLALFWGGLEILKTISFHPQIFLIGTGIFFGIIAWLIHSLFDTTWQSLQLSILWWFLLGVLLSLPKVAQSLKSSNSGV